MGANWEEASACGVCGSEEWRLRWSIRGRKYVVCRDCGVLRLYDRVAEDQLGLLYSDYYPTVELTPSELDAQLENPTFRHRLDRLEACINGRDRRVLEIGCGDGNFLAVLRNAGWQVQGQEFSAEAATLVERRHGIPMFVGSLADVVPAIPFEAVLGYHVLEHIYHPIDWLQRVRTLIAPGGLLHLQMPNAGSLTQAATGRACASIVFPQHVYFYTPRTLRALLERMGFEVLATTTWDPWHGPGALASSVKHVVRAARVGHLPWSDDLDEGIHRRSERRSISPTVVSGTLGRLVDLASVPLARAEAAVGRGGVVDVVARRTD